MGALSRHRAEHHLRPKQRKVVTEDLELVKELATKARRQAMRSDRREGTSAGTQAQRPWTPEVHAELKRLRTEHWEEFDAELGRRFDEAGLARYAKFETPSAEKLWTFAVEHALVEKSPAEATLLTYTDAAFRDLVLDDVTGTHCPDLRLDGVLPRWKDVLKAVSTEQAGTGTSGTAAHDARAARRGRFHSAVMERQTEANALMRASHVRLRGVIRDANRIEDRKQVVNAANAWLLDKYAPELLGG